jgi:hypothetical protein
MQCVFYGVQTTLFQGNIMDSEVTSDVIYLRFGSLSENNEHHKFEIPRLCPYSSIQQYE